MQKKYASASAEDAGGGHQGLLVCPSFVFKLKKGFDAIHCSKFSSSAFIVFNVKQLDTVFLP